MREYCVAVHNHLAEEVNELSFVKGDIIEILEKHPSGWYKGQLNGQCGVFPGNYTRPEGSSHSFVLNSPKLGSKSKHMKSKSVAMALYDHVAEEPNELTFALGERILVELKHESGWWRGRNQSGDVGIFPANYVVEERKSSIVLPSSKLNRSKSWYHKARKRYGATQRAWSSRHFSAHRQSCCSQLILLLRLAIPCWSVAFGDFEEDEDSEIA